MKPRDVQRSVRSQRVDRAAGDAPSIGRVGRVPGTGMPKGERRRRKRGEGRPGDRTRNNRTKVVLTWSAVFALLALGAMGVAIWFWMRTNMNRPAGDAAKAAPVMQERVVSEFESPSEGEALSFVSHALAIRDPLKVPEYFRLGSANAAEVMDFLGEVEKTDGEVSSMDWLSSMDTNGLLIDGVIVNFSTGAKPRNRLALLTPDPKGRWKIDFEAFARKVRPAWNELLEKNSGRGTVRVIVAKDSYFNGVFIDESQWACYGMASPDNDSVLLGYCRKGTPQAAAMERIVADEEPADRGRSLKRATLEILRHEGSEARQFEIARVLAEDWVMGLKPFDENFE